MDNRRLVILGGLAVVAFALYQSWMLDYGPKPEAASEAPVSATAAVPVPAASSGASATAPGTPPAVPAAAALPKGQEIHVRTDVLDLVIDTAGGDIRRAELLKYPETLKDPDQHVRVLDDRDTTLLVLQGGLQAGEGMAVPGGDAVYSAPQHEYLLAEGADGLQLTLHWSDGHGLAVDKTYTLKRGSYQIGVSYAVANGAKTPWSGGAWMQWQNRFTAPHTGMFSVARYDYQRVALHGADGYKQLEFPKVAEEPVSQTADGGWIALVEHYFLAAIIPGAGQKDLYYSKPLGDGRFVSGTLTAPRTAAPGGSARFDSTLYLGPKLQTQLAAVAPQLELTVDYGKLTIIAEPIFWVLERIQRYIGNWGWSILLLTVLIKAVTYKLNEISGRSMAHMRHVQPRIKAIQERYADDRQRMSQAMMELYKKEKINPASGCLPIVIQIPIFFALYWVLVDSVELRHAPWALWIHDLSAPDPFYVLPVVYAAAMFIQQHLQPQPADKTQAMMMKFMPLALAFLYMVLPSGLVLYYLANSLISIAQQRYINNLIEREYKNKKS